MSKTALKKAIKELDPEQLRELILDIYEAKCDSRYYLDFFVNPDINTRLEAAKAANRERTATWKQRRQQSTNIGSEKAIASITCLQPGPEECVEIMKYGVVSLCLTAHVFSFKEGLVKSTAKLLNDTLVYADRNQLLGSCLTTIERAINELPSPFYRRSTLKQALKAQFQTTLDSLATL